MYTPASRPSLSISSSISLLFSFQLLILSFILLSLSWKAIQIFPYPTLFRIDFFAYSILYIVVVESTHQLCCVFFDCTFSEA